MKLKSNVKRTLFTTAALFSLSCGMAKLMVPEPPKVDWKEHFVEQGETVWMIAKESNVHHSDLRDVVDMIQSRNHIDAELKPGMVIEYPVSKK